MFYKPSVNLNDESKTIKSTKLSSARLGMKLPKEWRDKLSVAANKEEVKLKKSKTNFLKYGIENPGVLGAYSSKAAKEYIFKYLISNNIEETRAMFKGKEKKEFFQMIDDPFGSIKKKYVSYDLVVFNTKEAKEKCDLSKVDIVLEYNGPWHYRRNNLSEQELDLPATPYKNSPSRKQQIILENAKISHIMRVCPNARICIFWEKEKELEILRG